MVPCWLTVLAPPMIASKEDYRFYVEADRVALRPQQKRPRLVDDTWRFQRLLRKVEYYMNCKRSPWARAYLYFLLARYHWMSQKLGFTIWPNTIGPGLCLAHRGNVLISANAQIGENVRIHAMTSIGSERRYGDEAAKIGNNVYIGPGAKVFGGVVIGDDVAIGANAVVEKSFEDPHQTIAGVPARKISDKGTEGLLIRATELVRARATAVPAPAGIAEPSKARAEIPIARVSRRVGLRRGAEKAGLESGEAEAVQPPV
jgi:serine O-acetyltransferase